MKKGDEKTHAFQILPLPFIELTKNNLLGFNSHCKFKYDAHGTNYKAFIVSFL